MLSQRERNITKSIEFMFQNMEHDDLKQVMLAVALNKSQEEKDRIAEELKQQKEKDLEYIKSRYENEDAQSVLGEVKIIVHEQEEQNNNEKQELKEIIHYNTNAEDSD
jgi:replication-associated recombination protein RarA